jgi:hypothetical protein
MPACMRVGRYRLGTPGTAKALLLFREGWSALPQFGPVDRGAILVVGASMLPYSPPLRPKVPCAPCRHAGDVLLCCHCKCIPTLRPKVHCALCRHARDVLHCTCTPCM